MLRGLPFRERRHVTAGGASMFFKTCLWTLVTEWTIYGYTGVHVTVRSVPREQTWRSHAQTLTRSHYCVDVPNSHPQNSEPNSLPVVDHPLIGRKLDRITFLTIMMVGIGVSVERARDQQRSTKQRSTTLAEYVLITVLWSCNHRRWLRRTWSCSCGRTDRPTGQLVASGACKYKQDISLNRNKYTGYIDTHCT